MHSDIAVDPEGQKYPTLHAVPFDSGVGHTYPAGQSRSLTLPAGHDDPDLHGTSADAFGQ